VAIGLAIALIMFVVQYSRTDVVKHALSGGSFRSRVDRDPADREVLRRDGDGIHILELQGFVFFGTATSLLGRIRERAREATPVRFMVIDFRRVSGVDSSAVMSFVRAQQLAEAEGFTLVLSGIRPRVRTQLERGGFVHEHLPEGGLPSVRELPDLDHAVQWCEDMLLGVRADGGEGGRSAILKTMLGEGIDLARLAPYLNIVDTGAGEEVIRQGDDSDDLYLLTEGRLTARMTRDDGQHVRLRTMGPGSVVGEVALYLGGARVASVVSEEPSRFYRLSRDAFERMERDDPDLAAALHRAFARLLAERLTDTLRTMEALLD
jgi:SulP family sulfate permease